MANVNVEFDRLLLLLHYISVVVVVIIVDQLYLPIQPIFIAYQNHIHPYASYYFHHHRKLICSRITTKERKVTFLMQVCVLTSSWYPFASILINNYGFSFWIFNDKTHTKTRRIESKTYRVDILFYLSVYLYFAFKVFCFVLFCYL